ncbi:nuclear transport factor 2 family protein [Agromyces aureus]|uniref:DUF4440 domain-containing protein n=1 Tax=Agromyces aureus TaxID=453304 RepID=A0A191WBT5_9MICO|nr:nuclear transport factor 2 family protein [Agromyces aureus]ANJ25644.1 hypothetical protein ATC03_01565 [Agromyces aureus]
MSARDESGRTIDQAEEAIQAAMRASDLAELDLLIADDLAFSGPDGAVVGKAADLEAHRTGATRFERIEETLRRTTETPEGGTTETTAVATVWNEGRWVDVSLRWVRDWRIIDGRWQVASGSVTILG